MDDALEQFVKESRKSREVSAESRKKELDKIIECNKVEELVKKLRCTPAMREALLCTVLQRKATLLERMNREPVHVIA
ncbi:hypothetical protein N9112_00290 [bacterium]|nr:hypothetical protein [bacterium]